MSLLICPECNNTISDKATCCPNCGMPIETILRSNSIIVDVESTGEVHRKRSLGMIILYCLMSIAILFVAILGFILFNKHVANKRFEAYEQAEKSFKHEDYELAAEQFLKLDDYKDSSSRAIYCEALVYCNSGDYENAFEELMKIQEFEGVDKLLMQIYYETRLFEGINNLRTTYFNPDSIGISDVSVYYVDSFRFGINKPVIIATTTGQNKLGGYTANYVLFGESDKTGSYIAQGSTDSLDSSDYLWMGGLSKKLVTEIINEIKTEKRAKEIKDAIDLDRVSKIIKSGEYSKIKRIEKLQLEDIPLLNGEDT